MLHESKILTASFYRVAVVSEGLNLSIYILDATILCHVLLTKCYQVEVPPMLMVRRALPAGARWPALHRGKSEEVKSKSLHCSLETVKLGRDSLLLPILFICPHLESGWGSMTSRWGWRWWRRRGRWSGTTRRSSWLRTARCPARGGTCVKVATLCRGNFHNSWKNNPLALLNLWLRREGVGEGRMVTSCTLFWEPCSFRSSGSWHTTLYLHNICLFSTSKSAKPAPSVLQLKFNSSMSFSFLLFSSAALCASVLSY